MYRLRDPHWFSHTTRHDKVTTDKTMTRESATSGHTRQLPPGDKTKEKQTRHATKTNQKTKSRKRLSQTFCYFFFSSITSFAHSLREKNCFFFFRTLFSLQLVINQAANVTISQRTNRTPEIRLEHIPSWSQAKKKYVYTEREGTKNQLHARRQ